MHLSGGMRRRLSLACTLVHEPPVLFLDEPTVGVDPALRVQFWAHFRRLAAAGTTILVASHVMDEADRCDELLFMRSGQVIAQGTRRSSGPGPGPTISRPAFLHFSGLDAEGRPLDGAAAMSARRILAVARRIAQGFRRDERTLGLIFVVPRSSSRRSWAG